MIKCLIDNRLVICHSISQHTDFLWALIGLIISFYSDEAYFMQGPPKLAQSLNFTFLNIDNVLSQNK